MHSKNGCYVVIWSAVQYKKHDNASDPARGVQHSNTAQLAVARPLHARHATANRANTEATHASTHVPCRVNRPTRVNTPPRVLTCLPRLTDDTPLERHVIVNTLEGMLTRVEAC